MIAVVKINSLYQNALKVYLHEVAQVSGVVNFHRRSPYYIHLAVVNSKTFP